MLSKISIFHPINLSPSLPNLIQLMPVFHPVFYISAIATYISDYRNFPNQRHGCGINIVPACMAVGIVRYTDNVLRLTFWTAFCIFHIHILLKYNGMQHSIIRAADQSQMVSGHVLTTTASNSIINGTRYFRG